MNIGMGIVFFRINEKKSAMESFIKAINIFEGGDRFGYGNIFEIDECIKEIMNLTETKKIMEVKTEEGILQYKHRNK